MTESGNVTSTGPAAGRGPVRWLIGALAIGLSLFQLYGAGIQGFGLFYQRGIHLGVILLLALLLFPAFGQRRGWLGWLVDLPILGAALASGFYLVVYLDEIISRAGFFTDTDILMGGLLVLVLLEACRRAVGLAMTLIAVVFMVYALAGPRGALPAVGEWMPGILSHRGASLDRLVGQLSLGQEGIYGLPLGVAATYVFIFVLFGAFLEVTGAGRFFIDMAYALAGRQRGGPAKAAVLASAGMGSISGSAIANVVTTGAFTIPLMKRLGYKPHHAGGIEAAASTGGQIAPPIMGAGAFLIAEYTGTSYLEVVKVSVIPAILYFATVYLFVHVIAIKENLQGLTDDEIPLARDVLRRGWHFLLPLGVLIWLLVYGYSPTRVGFHAIVTIVLAALAHGAWRYLRQRGPNERPAVWPLLRSTLGKGVEALELGGRNAVAVSLACAVAGIVVGVVGLSGVGLKFSSLMIAFSGGNVVIALFLVMVASLVLGLGLPVTASYIVLVVIVGPALTDEFGIPLLIAHLVVFWYSQDSNVTPPVALAAFAAAAVAGSKPMATGMQAWKFAKGLYLIPLFLVFNPELVMGGSVAVIVWNAVIALVALGSFVAALEGYLFTWIRWPSRLLLTAGTVAVFYPSLVVEAAGVAVIVALLAANRLAARRGKG